MFVPGIEHPGLNSRRDLLGAPLLLAAFVIVLLTCSGRAEAQEPGVSPRTDTELTPESIAERKKQIEEMKDLDDALRTRILEMYRQAADSLKRSQDFASRAAEYKKQTSAVQERATATKAELVSLKSQPEPELPPEASPLPTFEQELAKHQSELDARRKTLAELEAEPSRRANRRKEIRALLVSSPDRIAEIAKQLEAPPPAEESPQLTLARRTELAARRQALQREPAALENEIALYDAEDAADLTSMRSDLFSQQIEKLEKQVKRLTDTVNERRRIERERAVAAARRQQEEVNHPLLRAYAESNTALAQEALSLTPKIELTGRRLKETEEKTKALNNDFKQTKDKVDSIGLTWAVGLLLRKQRPDIHDYRRPSNDQSDEIDDIQFRLFELYDERAQVSNIEPKIQEIQQHPYALELNEDEEKNLEQAARDILQRRREYLDAAIRGYNDYFNNLLSLEIKYQSLLKEVEEYAHYVDERVLWIRSTKWLSPSEMRRDRSLAQIADRESWRSVGALLISDVRQNPIPFCSALLLFGALGYYRTRFRRELKDIGVQAQRGTYTRFAPTARAVLLTAIISLFGPGIVWYLAWRMKEASQGGVFADAVAQGLRAVAAVYLPLEFLRQSCRNDGLAEAHFGWSLALIRLLRRRTRWLMIPALPLLFVTVLLNTEQREQGNDTLERIAFIFVMIAIAVFIRGILHPTSGLFGEVVSYKRGGWFDRLKSLWQWLGMLIPIAISVLAFAGYYYSARQLAWRLALTCFLLAGCVYLRAFLLRLLLVHRRRLSMQQARQRRAAAEERATSGEAASSAPPLVATEDSKGADLAVLSSQTQRLLTVATTTVVLVGFWWIWIDMLPALNILDRWTLWTTVVEDTQQVSTSPGQTSVQVVEKMEPITVANLFAALFIAVITVLAARNIPGLLEITLLQRLPLDAAARYAVTTIARYVIVLAGVVFVSGTIGIGWSEIQWLATALTFGLAFGLQEIFANFVAGLIILFERPIRVGDVVTIGDVSGIVSRIRIRATTITNWDKQEYIVPNKEFITGRLLNWTLSDTTNRIVLQVGVAYGSDTALARKLLLESADEHPLILKEPKPTATFDAFGDSALNFTLRVYLPEVPIRLDVVNDLHAAVDQKFRAAGIEIAFPQRDIHIRSAAGMVVGPAPSEVNASITNPAESNHVAKET